MAGYGTGPKDRGRGGVSAVALPTVPPTDVILAEIQGRAQIEPGIPRWRYAWQQVRYLDDLTVERTGMAGTTDENYALNNTETYNVATGTGTQGNSVDESGADFPAGFTLQPVGGAAMRPVVVTLTRRQLYNEEGRAVGQVWTFDYPSSHDGAC